MCGGKIRDCRLVDRKLGIVELWNCGIVQLLDCEIVRLWIED